MRHISKSNEITIINTYGIILIFDYLGNTAYEKEKNPFKKGGNPLLYSELATLFVELLRGTRFVLQKKLNIDPIKKPDISVDINIDNNRKTNSTVSGIS